MNYTYNQIVWLEKIISAIFSVIIIASAFLTFFLAPSYFIYVIIAIFVFVIVILILTGYLLILKNEPISKKLIFILPLFIVMLLYFMIVAIVGMNSIGFVPADFPLINQLQELTNQIWFSYFPYALLVLAFIMEIPIIFSMESLPYETYFTREKVFKEGIDAKATILQIKDQGLRMDGFPFYNLTLEVISPTNGTYTVTRNLMVPDFDLQDMRVGKIIDVKIDPKNPKKVFIGTWSGKLSE